MSCRWARSACLRTLLDGLLLWLVLMESSDRRLSKEHVEKKIAKKTAIKSQISPDLQYFVTVSDVVVVDVDVEGLFIVEAVVVVFHRLADDSLLRFHANKIHLNMH